MVVDLIQPGGKVLLFRGRKRIPHLFRGGQDAAGNGGHFHIALVVFAGGAPVVGAGRVGTGSKAAAVNVLKFRVRAAAHPKGHQCPQRAAEGFQFNGVLVVGYARFAQVQPGTAGRVVRFQRVQKLVHQGGKVGFGLQFHYQYISQSLVRRVSASM